jgi:hypothetical protein
MGRLVTDDEMIGRRFGQLVVTARAPRLRGRTAWLVTCDCGEHATIIGNALRTGNSKSCGCAKLASAPGRTHGLSGTRAHAHWKAAKQRCFDANAENYPYYGGRGIIMDPVWASDFAAFFRDMGECPPRHTLERMDFDGNYEPGNCRWATQAEQVKNTSRNIFVEHGGERLCLKDYAHLLGVGYNGLRYRMREKGEDASTAAKRLLERRHQRRNSAPAAST